MTEDLPQGSSALTSFLAVRSLAYPALLDSARDPEDLGRRSFVAAEPFLVVHGKGDRARLEWRREGREETWSGNAFTLLRRLLTQYRASRPGPEPLACGGVIGYLAYDLFPHAESLRQRTRDDLQMPDLFLAFYDSVAVFDHLEGTARAYVAETLAPPGERDRVLAAWRGTRPGPGAAPSSWLAPAKLALESNFSRADYCEAVRTIQEHIAAGDIYQANLSQRFAVPLADDPVAFYQHLRATSPAPFGACLFPDGFTVLSNSPERYLRIDGDRIETRPIKGTRPRGRTPEEDARLADELRHSVKDRAEHLMIVDLERNDLGRVCTYASVHVPQFEAIESYANVHHMVSTVAGRIHPSRDVVDCLRNSFPGGSITGAPKVRAMEVIDALEPNSRGVYCGSVGYIDFAGRVDLNIAIRTAVHTGTRLYFQVGGGIVADSDPDEEYEETLTKAQAFLKVLTGEGRVWPASASA